MGKTTLRSSQPGTKFEFGAEAQGWHVVDFAEPPVTVTDWAPYVEDYQSKGAEALWPADTANIGSSTQAMATAGYHPVFVALGTQFANSMTQQAVAANPSRLRSTSRRHGGRSRSPRQNPL